MDDVQYEQAVKQQLTKTVHTYQREDGSIDLDGWLEDTRRAFGVPSQGTLWRRWAYEVVGAKGYDELRHIGHVIPFDMPSGGGEDGGNTP